MTGPEHYREAERLLEQVEQGKPYDVLLAVAQVHAMLANAAASAQNIRRNGAVRDVDAQGWDSVLR